MTDIETIKDAIGYMNIKHDVQFEKSDKKGYKLCCPDSTYLMYQSFKEGDHYSEGEVHFKNDEEVIAYVKQVIENDLNFD